MKKRITVSKEHPEYWEYDGEPVMLLGGSVEDNLFQIQGLKEHLTLLRSVGGNYVRCTMSSRDDGNIWPYEKRGELYDLRLFSDEYWRRLSDFLQYTYELDILVQIEVFDRFDFAREPWQANPFNPRNNCNYTSTESLLVTEISTHPGANENRFFYSVPGEDDNQLLLGYQTAFVDRLLDYALPYPHVLYCMDNETCGSEKWGKYWAEHIKKRASERGLEVHTTEMWDAYDLSHDFHKRTYDHPEVYSFCDISQNNHNTGDVHWDGIKKARALVKDQIRPLNNVKIYGSDQSRYGTRRDGIERFWRNIFGKAASARFHRPPSGLGLSYIAQRNLKSARMLLEEIDIFHCWPCDELLKGREDGQSYCIANPGKEIAVYICREGKVSVDASSIQGGLTLMRLDIDSCEWIEESSAQGSGEIEVFGKTDQVVVIKGPRRSGGGR